MRPTGFASCWPRSGAVQSRCVRGGSGCGRTAVIVLASLALFAVGAVIGVLNGRGGLRSGMRQLLIGGGAALLVYLIGRGVGALTGVQLGGR